MLAIQTPNTTDHFSTHCIRRTAKRLVSEGVFARSELEDVMQELQLALLIQSANYDPARSRWTTFVKTVMRYIAISLSRHRFATRRLAPQKISSLNVLITDADGALVELGSTVSEAEHRGHFGHTTVDPTEMFVLNEDVQAVVSKLPPELQQLCELLKSHSVAEAGRQLGWPRRKLAACLDALRERFSNAGLALER